MPERCRAGEEFSCGWRPHWPLLFCFGNRRFSLSFDKEFDLSFRPSENGPSRWSARYWRGGGCAAAYSMLETLADPSGTNLRRCALAIASAAVEWVRTEVDATGVTPREPSPESEARIAAHGAAVRVGRIVGSAIWIAAVTVVAHLAVRTPAAVVGVSCDAHALVAVRRRLRADVAACAAVVGIGIQDAALAVARHRPLDASVDTRAADALAEFKGARVGAAETATAAVVEVVFQIGAIISATRLAVGAAIVAAGAAVRVGAQVAACTVANRCRTAGIVSARTCQAAGVAVACLAGCEALISLRLVGAAIAKGLAGILLLAGPGRARSEGTQHSPCQSRSQPAQRLPPRHRVFRQRFREFIPLISHFNHLS